MRTRAALAFLVSLCLGLTILLPPGLALATSSPAGSNTAIESLVGDLFTMRNRAVTNGDLSGLSRYYADSNLVAFEVSRAKNFRALEDRWSTKIVDAKTSATIKSLNLTGDTAEALVNEWIFFDWTDENGNVVTSGMGTNHSMTLRKRGDGWVVTADAYDEGPLTGVTSPSYIEPPKKSPPPRADAATKSPGSSIGVMYVPGATPYDRTKAVNYANTYVYNQANGAKYETYYNNMWYKNYNPWGGDCANFVSQSLYAGGHYFVGFGVDSSSNWWYDNKGTAPGESFTADDVASATWTYVPSQMPYMVPGWGAWTTGSSLVPGDIVYYNWNKDTIDSIFDHVTIVVAKASDGTPLVNSHNNDYYHLHWDYGYPQTVWKPVHMYDTF